MTCNEECALLTPLHIAIQNKHLDLVKFITSMHVDLRMALTADIEVTEYQEHVQNLFPSQYQESKMDYDGNYKSYY